MAAVLTAQRGRGGAHGAAMGRDRRFAAQVVGILRAQFRLSRQQRRMTLCELIAPALLMCLVGLLTLLLPPSLPGLVATDVSSGLDDGQNFPCLIFDDAQGMYGYGRPIPGAWCVPLVYAPNSSSDVQAIMATVAARNGLSRTEGVPSACATDNGDTRCMAGFETVDALKAWAAAHPGRAGLGVIFGDTAKISNPDGTTSTAQVITSAIPHQHVKYEVWYNETTLEYKWSAYLNLSPRHTPLS